MKALAAMLGRVMRRQGFWCVRISRHLQHAFPLGDDRGRDCVAHHIGGRAAHIEEGVHAEQQRNPLNR